MQARCPTLLATLHIRIGRHQDYPQIDDETLVAQRVRDPRVAFEFVVILLLEGQGRLRTALKEFKEVEIFSLEKS
jgi:hypothetical protein